MEATKQTPDHVKATEAGVSKSTWSMYQSGKRSLSPETKERVDAVLTRYRVAEREAVSQERAEKQHELAQHQLENLAVVGQRVVGAT